MQEMNEKICQSCGMPMEPEVYGTNADGSKNDEYCCHCYANGAFTSDVTMEQMIAVCVPFMATEESGFTAQQAQTMMEEMLPTLKRWKQ